MADSRRVLLTGATGFVGGHIHAALHRAGIGARALLRPDSPGLARLPPYTCDVTTAALHDKQALGQALIGMDAVIYAAGTVRGRQYDQFLEANVTGVQALAEVLQTLSKPPPLLLISSLAASQPELSDYARSKAAGEDALRAAALDHWSILRPPAVYGPGDVEMRGLLKTIRRGFAPRPGSATQRLSLIHAADLAAAVMAWLDATIACRGQTFAIDDGYLGADGLSGYGWDALGHAVHGAPVRQIPLPASVLTGFGHANQLFARLFDYAPMLTPGKVRELRHERWLCDNSAFSHLTGWRPRITLVQGVHDLFEGA